MGRPPTHRAVIAIAESQHGVIGTFQLRELGLTRSDVYRLKTVHGWEAVSRHVLRREGSGPGPAQRVVAAVLDAGAGAALSHQSAAAWFGHRGSRLEQPVHVTTSAKLQRSSPLARVHEVRLLPPELVVVHEGVPTVCAEVVALHLFATMRYEQAERITETMWSRRMLSGRSVGRLLALLAKQGRNGIVGLRRYWEERGDGYTPTDSGLESRTRQILDRAGIDLRKQVPLGAEDLIGRVDFVHPELPVVVEVQSDLHHSSFLDRLADDVRLAGLRDAGFVVAEIPEEWVWTDPQRVVRRVRAAIAEASVLAGSRRPA